METEDRIARLAQMLSSCSRAVFFGGAGVSTESGIPDFRSVDGLYHQKWKYPPETILSHSFFMRNTAEFYRFYREKMLIRGAEPNDAHKSLARLEEMGILSAVITQNIDGLHQKAGSRNVIELHGTTLKNRCTRCGAFYNADALQAMELIPVCSCGGVIKPEVVLYEESLPTDAIESALYEIDRSDLLIIGGTSLSVYPAAGFVSGYRGRIVIINKSPTPMDEKADLLISEPIGQTLKQVMKIIDRD